MAVNSRLEPYAPVAEALAAYLHDLIEKVVSDCIEHRLSLPGCADKRELISRREAARLLGVRTSRINEFIRDGELVLLPEGVHGKLSRRNVSHFLDKISQKGCDPMLGSGSSRGPRHG